MSCRDACVSMDYDCYNDFSREAWPRAAKPHECVECGAVIPKGEKHQYVTGKSEGMFWDARTCAPCSEIRKVFCCGSWVLEMLWEEIGNQLFDDWDELKAVECLARLNTDEAVALMRSQYKAFCKDREEGTLFQGRRAKFSVLPHDPKEKADG